MNLELFLARRLYSTRKGGRRISRPAVAIAQWGVAVGTLVMFVSICIIVGFKQQIRDKVIGFGGHIQVMSYEALSDGATPVRADSAFLEELLSVDGVEHVQPFAVKPGMVVGNDEYEGILLKGVGSDYDLSFIKDNVIEGKLPVWSNDRPSNAVALSRSTAGKLRVNVGDKVNVYFLQDGIKARRMTVDAIYETHLSELDDIMALTDVYTVRRLNGWDSDEFTGVELAVNDYDMVDFVSAGVNEVVERNNSNGDSLYAPTIDELYPSLFAWLSVLDQTVWLILILVLFIAGFTTVSGLLILILEKSNFIGVMKAIGSRDVSIARVFLYYSCFIIGKGILWGNVIAVVLCLLQQQLQIVGLDPSMYYMDCVPVGFTWLLVPMNIGIFVLSVLMLLLPSMFISRIEPTKAIKFE
ncbi:MAG: ABC transporter permease [Bacteroidaceae bacterium]|nr:ABC transporter permease [Bacteroidaceae bacterium]